MQPELIITLTIGLVGSAGLAALVASASQFTRVARWRHLIERHAQLARSFDPNSAPARALMVTAQNAALELAARSCVRLSGWVRYWSTLFGVAAAALVFSAVINMWAVARSVNGADVAPEVAPRVIDFKDFGEGLPELWSSGTVWIWFAASAFLALAVYPLLQLAARRRAMVRKLLRDPRLLEKAQAEDIRVTVYGYGFGWMRKVEK